MWNRLKFRAALKTEHYVIIAPVESVEVSYYVMRAEVIKKLFDKNIRMAAL